MESFSGKVAVVTGGGSGMGRELVRLLAAAGCSVAACDWRPAAVEQDAATARAVGGGASFVRDSREEWERTFAVDWQGVCYRARVFLPLPIKSGDGVLVNTSSVGGFWTTGGPGMPNTAYAAAKFAVRGFTEALFEDLRTRALARLTTDFRDKAPLSAAGAAAVILDGVRSGAWRILVGEDARRLDAAVRARPDAAYDYAELFSTAPPPSARDPGADS